MMKIYANGTARRRWGPTVLIVVTILLFLMINHIVFAQEHNSESEYELGLVATNFMVRKYAKVEDEAIRGRVQAIWKKLSRVVDKRIGVNYTIDILDTDTIGAWAYPGGFILITKGLVDLATTDDELGFVIAHELGHQARGHVDRPMEPELEEKYRELIAQKRIEGQGFVNEFVSEITRQKEIEADEYGVLYTSLAGYDVSAAFSILDKVITNDDTKTHPSKEVRQRKLQERLEGIINKLEFFEMGVIFYNIEEYKYAESAFRNFLNVYPSREVYNNLAATLHQEAFTYYTPEYDIPTKKTIQIDTETLAKKISTSKEVNQAALDKFKEALNQAIDAYKKAIDQDPDYAISYNNLGCAYDDLGEFDFATVYFKKAIKKWEDYNPQTHFVKEEYKEAYNNLGVTYIHLEEFEEAVANLKKAIQLDANYADAYFNMAMAYEALGESRQIVEENLKQFLEHNLDKQSNLVKIAREKLGLQTIEVGFKLTSDNPPPERPQALGSRKELEQFLGPPTRSVNLNPAEKVEVYLYPDKGTKLVTYGLRGTVIGIIAEGELAASTPEGISVGHPKENLIATYGEPQKVTEMGGLLYYLYPNNGLLFSLQVEKVKSWMVWLGTK